jgi:hypothetical protein
MGSGSASMAPRATPHQSSYVRRRGYSPMERAADGMPELTPEQLAALRESAIQISRPQQTARVSRIAA